MAQPCCGSRRCTCQIIAGPGITVTGNGIAGTPYVVEADGGGGVSCEQVRGCISGGDGIAYDPATGGISADISGDAGNMLTTGTDGGLLVPAAPAPETACGLTGDGSASAPLAAVVAAWPYADCTVDDYAGRVYCGTDGALRSEPRPVATYQQEQLDQVYDATLVPTGGGDTPVEDRPMTVINPDPCREAFVLFEVELDVEFTLPPNSAALYAIGGDDMWRVENKSTQQVNDIHVQTTKVYHRVIPPGGTLVDPLVIGLGGNYNNNATYHRIQTFHRAFIFNL